MNLKGEMMTMTTMTTTTITMIIIIIIYGSVWLEIFVRGKNNFHPL